MRTRSSTSQPTAMLVLVFALAGALAVPLHTIATPLAAIIAAAIGLAALRVWRWSGLPQPARAEGRRALLWLCLGLCVGLLVLAVIRLVIEPIVPAIGARMAVAGTMSVWRRLEIIYVAAVVEELIFRVLLLSAVSGILARLSRSITRPSASHVWIANAVSALLFGGVHLFSWSAGTGPALPLTVVLLNFLGGLAFGYVFATRGIVAAMWTHAGADCAIQLIGPLTG
ncbi:MAG TPA: CPBP family intramembrane glutamic endopeptidase [Vicinamibacterales bacterium]|nr:CPBP family intramembrane glutamic endopeptidase [Vicinamibacterales bacterium]